MNGYKENSYLELIENEIKDILSQRNGTPLYGMLRYHFGWEDEQGQPVKSNGGKKIRALLSLFSCKAEGADPMTAIPFSAAIELVHNFTLIHDDIQDQDAKRRNRTTVWKIWGIAQAINAGDVMHTLAYQAISRLEDISAEKIIKCQNLLTDTILDLFDGQYKDINFENRFDVTEETYLNMIRQKTGALFSCACRGGAIIATESEEIQEIYHQFGLNIGLAFQIRDDYLSVWGNSDETGKLSANDIYSKKKSFPVVYALNALSDKKSRKLEEIYLKDQLNAEDVELALELIHSSGAKEATVMKSSSFAHKALRVLGDKKMNNQELVSLVEFIAERNH